jgi:hypothetical protein
MTFPLRLMKCFVFLSVAVALSVQSCAQCSPSNPATCAYVTDGSARDILAIDRPTGAIKTVASLSSKVGDPVQVRVGGDNLLYVVTATNILRMTLSGNNPVSGSNPQTVFTASKTGAAPTGFTGLRFDRAGNLYANTPGGVWVIPGVVKSAGDPATSFSSPSRLTTSSSCSSSGDLAFTAFGDLLIACNGGSSANISRCSSQGLAAVPQSCTPSPLPIAGAITGLAVDSLGDIVVASGSTVTSYKCDASCTTVAGPVNFGTDTPAYLEAVPDPPGIVQVGGTPPCNSASPSILVSTNVAGKNGKVWSIDTVSSPAPAYPLTCQAPTTLAPTLVATLGSNTPAVGMASPATLHTLTKHASGAASSLFNYGAATLELFNDTVTTSCDLTMTKQQLSVTAVNNRLAQLTSPAVTAITHDGEQSWVTGFHGAFPSACGMGATSPTHIGVGGFFPFINPHIVLLPDDPTNLPTVDELPFIYPIAPLQGNPGDGIIKNTAFPGVFTTTPATIILANVGLTANNGAGYKFCGFLSPFTDPGTGGKNQNLVKSGSSATFKFQLSTGNCSSGIIADSTASSLVTGFSVAQFADPTGLSAFKIVGVPGKGNSITPPSFKYDATGHLFLFTLDTTGYCNGAYTATANSDSFLPHTLVFFVTGGPC